MRVTAPDWYEALNGSKETVLCDLPAEAATAQALLAEADVVLESFRPGVADRLGVGPGDAPDTAVTARSRASASAAATNGGRATISTTSAGRACSNTRRRRFRRCRRPTSLRVRSAR